MSDLRIKQEEERDEAAATAGPSHEQQPVKAEPIEDEVLILKSPPRRSTRGRKRTSNGEDIKPAVKRKRMSNEKELEKIIKQEMEDDEETERAEREEAEEEEGTGVGTERKEKEYGGGMTTAELRPCDNYMTRAAKLNEQIRRFEDSKQFTDEEHIKRLIQPIPISPLTKAESCLTEEEANDLVRTSIPWFILHQGFSDFDLSVLSTLSLVFLDNLKLFCKRFQAASAKQLANPSASQQSPMMQCLAAHNLLPEPRLPEHYLICHRRRFQTASRRCKTLLALPLNEADEQLGYVRGFELDPVPSGEQRLPAHMQKRKRTKSL